MAFLRSEFEYKDVIIALFYLVPDWTRINFKTLIIDSFLSFLILAAKCYVYCFRNIILYVRVAQLMLQCG